MTTAERDGGRKSVVILRCDDVPEPDRSRYGDTEVRTGNHIVAAARAAGFKVDLRVIDVFGGEPIGDDDRDGQGDGPLYVLTGSATDPYARDAWVVELRAWIRRAAGRGARMYGICFGHQVIAEALGGRCGRHPRGWEVGNARVDVESVVHEVGGGGDHSGAWGRFVPPAGPLTILLSHQDEVVDLPPGAVSWLRGGFCRHQGFLLGAHIATVQGHPEYETAQVRSLYERRRAVLGNLATDAAQQSAAAPHSGMTISACLIRWLFGTD